jgi:hypothetical protein
MLQNEVYPMIVNYDRKSFIVHATDLIIESKAKSE